MQNSPRHLIRYNIYCCFSDTDVLIPQDYIQTYTAPNYEALFKCQNNQKFCLSFCHSLVSHPTSFFCTIYCIEFQFFCQLFLPQNIHSASNPCNISVGCVFFVSFYWLASNYILTYFPVCTGLTLGSII